MTLHPVVGHEDVRRRLAEAYRAGALPASLLLHGPRGIGKQRLALWLAQLIACQEDGLEPCSACGPCRMALQLEHPDIHWYFPLPRPERVSGDRLAAALEDARMSALADRRADPLVASHREKIEAIYFGMVQNLRGRAHKRPTMAGPVFIVGESELLVPQEASQQAANALLKLLEEPPGDACFILTSSEPGMLLATIRSRTVPVHVSPLRRDAVADFLVEHAGAEAEAASWSADLSQGSVGRALAFLPEGDEKGPLEKERRKAYELVTAATGGAASAGYAVAMSLPPAGARKYIDRLSFVEEWLRDLGAVAAGADERVINQDALTPLKQHVERYGLDPATLPDAFASVERARELARGNVNPQLLFGRLVRDLRDTLASTPTANPSR